MLELTGIHKSFGDVRVLNGVDLRLESGLVYTLRGGNGSGKTTLINIISGCLTPSKGEMRFKGKKIAKFTPYRVNRLGIGRTMLHNPALKSVEFDIFLHEARENHIRYDTPQVDRGDRCNRYNFRSRAIQT